MNARSIWSRILIIVGSIAMLVGAVDPMEGSVVILPGSGLVALGTFLGQSERRLIAFRVWVFILIAIGVGALWGLSMVGGIGGSSGHSMWWGVLSADSALSDWLVYEYLGAGVSALVFDAGHRGRPLVSDDTCDGPEEFGWTSRGHVGFARHRHRHHWRADHCRVHQPTDKANR